VHQVVIKNFDIFHHFNAVVGILSFCHNLYVIIQLIKKQTSKLTSVLYLREQQYEILCKLMTITQKVV